MSTNKCLKEWNAVVEALGQGKQSILIRGYDTTLKEFLLYPTYSYSNNRNYLDSFQDQYLDFVEKNATPKKENEKTEIKYYAKVDSILLKNPQKSGSLAKNSIWDKEHIKSYLKGKISHVWLLRVYKFNKPYMAEENRGIKYANLKKSIDVSNSEPILSDEEFGKIKEEIKKI